ncbi:MAG: chemotaxis response regulator protein-glutamate methylesterase [Rhodocyclaceae bacterium]|nr:chemotaxis response regulator protein-glutamate methylesterase [Rhodocyclaceae bacterium]MDZ4213383.1 chemotaxis response regulator protein-glutamate methylesterase [Rhodocyclaceae bacterium]
MAKIKVLVVDDSAVVRQVNKETLEKEADIEVIAVADPLYAIEKMKLSWPDVIVTDIEMPRMDGITFLKKIMSEHPTPFVVCSSLAEKGAAATMEALAAGALSIITKPKMGVKQFLQESGDDIVSAVRAAARANMRRVTPGASLPPTLRPKLTADAMLAAQAASGVAMANTTDKVIAIGTSTGGTQALEAVLTKLPATTAGIVVVQHMPEKFTAMFAERLNSLCKLEVREAKDGDRVLPGRALIAPGGRHMMLKRSGAQYYVTVADGPVVNRHKPSVDVLFRSVAQIAGRNALGVIMTGMGDDGARGMKEMHDAGAQTVAEDESTCVVFGMPKVAIDMGGVDKIVPLDRIPQEIIAYGR